MAESLCSGRAARYFTAMAPPGWLAPPPIETVTSAAPEAVKAPGSAATPLPA